MDRKSISNSWVEEVFKSVQNQKQVAISEGLFSKIEKRINAAEAKVLIPIWKIAAAAAIIITINLLALKNKDISKQNFNIAEYPLISNYNLYADE